MHLSINTSPHQHRLLLLICLLGAIGLSTLLALTADARPRLPQETSPLSPLPQVDTPTSPLLTTPSRDLAPLPSQPSEVTALPASAQAPSQVEAAAPAAPVTESSGIEPRRAQLSLTLVGLILVGLIGVVVSVVAQSRRT
ncbi:MAG: hypothetical protein R2873_36175 [Caldilineaceae bacterium]